MHYFRKSYEVVAYTYEADEHCLDCARKAWSDQILDDGDIYATDSEGNPVHPVFLDQTTEETFACGTCRELVTY